MASSDEHQRLLETFKALDQTKREALANLESPLELGLATLVLAADIAKVDHLSIGEMVEALDVAGVALQEKRLGRALSRAGNRVGRKSSSGEITYKVMLVGRRQVEPLLETGSVTLMYIDGDQP